MAAIEGIEKGLTTAIEHNKAMISCCENQKFDKIATMTCCTDLVKVTGGICRALRTCPNDVVKIGA